MRRTLEEMKKHNVVLGIVGGGAEEVDQFLSLAPGRILGSAAFGRPGLNVDSIRARYAAGKLAALGEVLAQYEGLSPSDSGFEPYSECARSDWAFR